MPTKRKPSGTFVLATAKGYTEQVKADYIAPRLYTLANNNSDGESLVTLSGYNGVLPTSYTYSLDGVGDKRKEVAITFTKRKRPGKYLYRKR